MIIQTIHPEIAFCRTGGDFDEKENVIILEIVLPEKNFLYECFSFRFSLSQRY